MQNKKIFIEIPTWLGDAIMTTPAIENLIEVYPNCELTIFGSYVSTKLFTNHPNVKNIIIDDSKKEGNRYLNLRKLAKEVGFVDIAFSFRKNFTTKVLLWFINANMKFRYERYTKKQRHQVLRYNDFINKSLSVNNKPKKLKICIPTQESGNEGQNKQATGSYSHEWELNLPTLGINPGATYGSAKRWYPQEFAKIAIELSSKYNIIIYGGSNEVEIAKDIENLLNKKKVTNYKNLAGKTSIEELFQSISTLNLFITNDSGSMHIAAAFSIPTVSIFGPTKYKETHQWQNSNEMLIRKDFDCMPCMKRECSLEEKINHQCMKSITAQNVLDKIYINIEEKNIKKKKLQKEFKKRHNLTKDTRLILFKAKNFKQNGAVRFLNIISQLTSDNFKAIVCGDESSINFLKKETQGLELKDKVIYLNDIAIKTCDIFILPTTNKKLASNVLTAMKERCIVFAPKSNEISKILDIFSTMQGVDDPNTIHKVDALLADKLNIKLIQKENKEKTISINN